ncbi:hypothetical protein ACHAP3_008656 [Botrytis cinerea]
MWNSRHSHLARQYPDAPLYGPFLMYITDEASWREKATDPDVAIPSIETDGETCSPRMNIGSGKEDPIELGGMDFNPDIPIPSIETDGDEFMDEEESEERVVELQNGRGERLVIEEESSGVLEARARDRDRDRDGYRS